MERNGRWATALAIFLATPVPLTSRQEKGCYWCEAVDADVRSLAGRAAVDGLHRFGCDEDWGDVRWSGVDPRCDH
jgi:hypothetical protein